MKQTAVEWLCEQLEWDDSKIARVIGLKKYNQVVKQAKEMEKQQIVNAHLLGLIYSLEMEASKQAEQYYNETFNKKTI
jgi:hypothetical protein